MATLLPEFLQRVKVTPGDRDYWDYALGNGFVLAQFLKDRRDEIAAHDIAVAMRIECERDAPRWYVLQRLKGAFNVYRNVEEGMKLSEWFDGS